MPRETLLEAKQDGVLVLTMNRPAAKNAYNERMYNELADALVEALSDRDKRCVVLNGAPGAFSAGQDLGEMGALPKDGPVGFERLLDALQAFDKPIVAAVNGVGLGLGLTILLHTDVNLVAASARLKLPFLPLGVVPEAGSSFLLPELIGYQRAAELVLTARWMSADEAVASGLALEKLPDERLMARALELAAAIAAQPPSAVRASKRLLKADTAARVKAARARENEEFLSRLGSPENLEAVKAFFEKRPPDFSKLPPE